MGAGTLTNEAGLTAREVSTGDRLTATLVLALLLHALIIFGVGFTPREVAEPRYDALEVVLVTRSEPDAPEDADLAAQANLDGGGESEATERPATPTDAPFPAPTPQPAQPAVRPAPPTPPTPPPPEPAVVEAPPTPTPETPAPKPAPPVPEPAPEVAEVPPEPAKAPAAEPAPAPASAEAAKVDPEPAAEPAAAAPEKLLAKAAAEPAKAELPDPPKQAPKPDAGDAEQTTEAEATAEVEAPATPPPSAAQLIASSMEMASLNAELEQRLEALAKRPRRKYISARTKEYKYAAYLEAWRSKVERVGNLNYPDSARNQKLSGSLLLDVALRPDGSVAEITVRRSSGHQLLDEAAINIVRLAAPYAPFPPDIRKEVDVLHITRTWQFLNSDRFSAN